MQLKSSWLDGKTALVTGAAKRLGRATALALAGEGVNVVVHYRSSYEDADDVVSKARDMEVKAWKVKADLSEPVEAEELFTKAIEVAGTVEILVNNASIFGKSRLIDFTLKELNENIQVNAISPLLIARAFAGKVNNGAIVNFLDTRFTEYDREHTAYHLTKRMLFSLTRMMALEFAPGIRVNAVAPGLILPPPGKDRSYLENLAPTNPLNRVGTVQGITDAVLFLLGSDFITGQVVFVDGGYHMKGYVYG